MNAKVAMNEFPESVIMKVVKNKLIRAKHSPLKKIGNYLVLYGKNWVFAIKRFMMCLTVYPGLRSLFICRNVNGNIKTTCVIGR